MIAVIVTGKLSLPTALRGGAVSLVTEPKGTLAAPLQCCRASLGALRYLPLWLQ